MVRIQRLDWRPDRVEHIARHDVVPDEVEQALGDGLKLVIRAGPAERNPEETIYRVYGRTEAGRYLFVALLLYEDGEEVQEMSDAAAKKQRGPTQGRIEELADFYDRTDTSELSGEEADDVTVERPELEQISIRLPKEDLEAIRRRAARSGVGYTTLIRMILREHLHGPPTR